MLHVICPNIFTLKENDFVLYYHTHGQYVCDQQYLSTLYEKDKS